MIKENATIDLRAFCVVSGALATSAAIGAIKETRKRKIELKDKRRGKTNRNRPINKGRKRHLSLSALAARPKSSRIRPKMLIEAFGTREN